MTIIDCSCCHKPSGSRESRNYREFLRQPLTLVTLASGILLIIAYAAGNALPGIGPDPGESENVLFLVAALVGSSWIWYAAAESIRNRSFSTEIPVSLAIIAAIAIGQYSAAAIVAVLLLAGEILEDFVAAKAGRAMEDLAKILPVTALVRRDGRETELPLHEVHPGDIVIAKSGERVPVDGEVVSGTVSVSQSAITGESFPVPKGPGDRVYAGTFVEIGAVEIRTEKTGDHTQVGKIRELIAEAEHQKPPVERVLDRYAKIYTPAAIIFGGLVWFWSGDILRAITMLIVFCPCVIVLSTPAALVAAIGNAARKGCLVKTGAAIESLASVDTVIFDKTGTLTTGTPVLEKVVPVGVIPAGELLRVAACAEAYSEHPLGKAVVREALREGIALPRQDPGHFHILPGWGVSATIDGRSVLLGSKALLAEREVAGNQLTDSVTAEASAAGRIVVNLAIDGTHAGILVFRDTLRQNVREAVASLHTLGIRTVLVSGDQKGAAEDIARAAGIAQVHAEVLPHDKVTIVRTFQGAGKKVAFVGDGINDGPALAAADVGIAMGLSGTDLAIETSQIALLSDDLATLPHLLSVSRASLSTIRNNLIFAIGVLIVAIALTIPGILSPVTGALLHEISSLPVILNSVRLIGYRSG